MTNTDKTDVLTDDRLAEWLDEVSYHFDRAGVALPVGLAHPSSMARRVRLRAASITPPASERSKEEATALPDGMEVVAWKMPDANTTLGKAGWAFITRRENPDHYEPGQYEALQENIANAEPLVTLSQAQSALAAMSMERDALARHSLKAGNDAARMAIELKRLTEENEALRGGGIDRHLCGHAKPQTYTGAVSLVAPPHMAEAYPRGVTVDVCLALEITKLWAEGITTTGCCCGHGSHPAYIGVIDADIPRMKSLGYVVAPNPTRPGDEDSFVPKTLLDAQPNWHSTGQGDLASAIAEFKAALPGWWYSVCECQVSCDASCAPTVESKYIGLIRASGDPFDAGFHADLPQPSTLAEALRNVMRQALDEIASRQALSGSEKE